MKTAECIIEQFKNENARMFNQERFKEEVSQAIFALMNHDDTRQSELAGRLNCSRANVSKMLGGSHNFTLETLADVFMALGRSVHLFLDLNLTAASNANDSVAALYAKAPRTPWTNYTKAATAAAASGFKTYSQLPDSDIDAERARVSPAGSPQLAGAA